MSMSTDLPQINIRSDRKLHSFDILTINKNMPANSKKMTGNVAIFI